MTDSNQIDNWIEAARSGDETACAALYRHYVGPVYRLAYGVLLNDQDAEEVVQDSFAYALRRIEHYDAERSAFKTWLFTITMSRCRNKRRRKWLPTVQLADMVDRLPGGGQGPEAIAVQRSARRSVQAALKELSPKLREAVVLRYFEGLTYREIADVLGCPQKTAESRVRLAHQALYDLLADQAEALLEGIAGYEAG